MRTRILSGTNDELGGVPVRIVNVYERPERPGRLSGLLVLDREERVIAVGDQIAVGEERFRLDAIESYHRTGGYVFVFIEMPRRRSLMSLAKSFDVHDIPGLTARQLIDALKSLTPCLLSELSAGAPMPAIVEWTTASGENRLAQWPGENLGPSTHFEQVARFAAPIGPRVEARLRHTITRWNPDEVHREELAGFWRHKEALLSISTSREGTGRFDHLRSKGLSGETLARILRAGIDA